MGGVPPRLVSPGMSSGQIRKNAGRGSGRFFVMIGADPTRSRYRSAAPSYDMQPCRTESLEATTWRRSWVVHVLEDA